MFSKMFYCWGDKTAEILERFYDKFLWELVLYVMDAKFHSFFAYIYIAPLQVGLLRSAPNSSAAK